MKKLSILLIAMFLIILVFCTIYSINYKQEQLPTVEITVATKGLLNSKNYDCILPLEALYTDLDNRNYILLVTQKDGAWGKEYFCSIRHVSVIDKDNFYVALNISKQLDKPVVSFSNKSISDGSEVKIKGND